MDYYGLIEEIMMIEYHSAVGLKAMIFKCKWFDTKEGRGMRKHLSRMIDVHPRKQYEKYDPFVLAGNCDQVCFIPYPRVRRAAATSWWACTKVLPREICETSEVALTALQDETYNHVVAQSSLLRVETHVVEDATDYDMLPLSPLNDEYISEDEMIESGSDQPPPFTELGRMTRTHKDGTFIDERAKSLVIDVEEAVKLMTSEDGSPNSVNETDSTTAFEEW
ncbi:hypothetical protein ISN44_As13g007750 [Arabidopsis suecica]|uniref:DUF4216 domain-containing protein n=1 Tax=Arabidopsis suecica TaxID=45249 RepID=A0A8T1XQB4_ARASU|nr:hypothetical protein ISN44_As13g007750 [Arabidopsis suecica]